MYQVIQSYRTGRLEVVEVPPPALEPGRLLIRTAASVVSAGTERHLVEMAGKSLLGKALARPDLVRRVLDKARADGVGEAIQQARHRLDTPVALGYSAAGVVAGVGEGVEGYRAGDRVACGGAGVAVHAEMLSAPPTMVARVPAGVELDQAAFAMVAAIALHGVRLGQARPGEWVAVIGLGLLGLLATQMLRGAGCRVIGLDVQPDRLDLARRLGAEAVGQADSPDAPGLVEAVTEGRGVDAALITASTPSNAPLELAARTTRERGRVVALGFVGLEVPRHLFFERELELVVPRGSGPGPGDPGYEAHGRDHPYAHVRWTHGRNLAECLRLIEVGTVRVEPLVTHRFPIERAAEAYAVLQGHGAGRPLGIVLDYPAREPGPAVIRLPGRAREGGRAPAAVTVGLVGAGLFARTTLLPLLRRLPGVRLAGVATRSGSGAHHVARAFGFEYAAAETDRILDDPDIRCVIIATRHDSHAALAARALRAGKDVFVEKPLALSAAELAEVAEAWRAGGGRLMVGFNRRHSPHTDAARRHLAGAAGPWLVHCRVNAGEVPAGSWVNDPAMGGDRVRGELCHFVDLALAVVGEPAVAVEAAALPPARAGAPAEDVVALLRFADGSLADLLYTARGHRRLPRERVEAFRGGRVAVIDNFRLTRCYGAGAPARQRTWRPDRGHRTELAVWFEALREGRPAPVPFEAYAASTLATLAVAEALRTGRPVAVAGAAPEGWTGA